MDLQKLAQDLANNALGGQVQSNGGLDGLLGGLLGGQALSQSGLGGLLGGLLGGQSGAGQNAGGLGAVLSAAQGGNKSAIMLALLPMVLQFVQKNGVGDILSKLGQNPSPSAVAAHFSPEDMQSACQATGQCQADVEHSLADLLPQVLNAVKGNEAQIGQLLKLLK